MCVCVQSSHARTQQDEKRYKEKARACYFSCPNMANESEIRKKVAASLENLSSLKRVDENLTEPKTGDSVECSSFYTRDIAFRAKSRPTTAELIASDMRTRRGTNRKKYKSAIDARARTPRWRYIPRA